MDPITRQNCDLVLRAVRAVAALASHDQGCTICSYSTFALRQAPNGDVYAYVWVETAVCLLPHWRVTGQPIFQRWPEADFEALSLAIRGRDYEGLHVGSVFRWAPLGRHAPIFRDLDECRAASRVRA